METESYSNYEIFDIYFSISAIRAGVENKFGIKSLKVGEIQWQRRKTLNPGVLLYCVYKMQIWLDPRQIITVVLKLSVS